MTRTPPDLPFAVVLRRESPAPVATIGKVLANRAGIPTTDAISRVRYGAGIVVEGVSEETADRIVEDLSGVQVEAVKVDPSRWLKPPPGYPVVALEFLESEILARLPSEAELVIAKRDIFGIDVYGLETPRPEEPEARGAGSRRAAGRKDDDTRATPAGSVGVIRETLLANLPGRISDLSPRGKALVEKLEEEGHTEVEWRMTLYCAAPTGPLHIRKDRFDYSCLGEQKRKHSIDNFLALIEEIHIELPELWNRDGAESLVRELDLSGVIRFKKEEVQNLHRFMHYWISEEAAGPGEETAR